MISSQVVQVFHKFKSYKSSKVIKKSVDNLLRQAVASYASAQRHDIWNKLSNDSSNKVYQEFEIHLLDSGIRCIASCDETPYSILLNRDKGLLENALIAKVNDELWDLSRFLVDDCSIKVIGFEDPQGRAAFWRSSAFVINSIIEKHYLGQICMTFANENGFYCDSILHNKTISSNEMKELNDEFSKIVNTQASFERLDIKDHMVEDVLKICPYKIAYVKALQRENKPFFLYRLLDYIDICEGPMIMNTGQLKRLNLMSSSSAKSNVDDKENSVQRVYGISFPNDELFEEWSSKQVEAKNRDHRLIGQAQQLFFVHPSSPGSPFMLPAGTHICNKLIDLIKDQYRKRGFSEVITPQIYDCNIWKTSGHWDHYQENIFKIPLSDEQMMTLKPMNCPSHCLIFAHQNRSYTDLPIRFADFGALHRNEVSGALTGLTRMRKFHQDDAHIFCRPDQVEQEIDASLDFLRYVYKILNFHFHLSLSTRPEEFLGEVEMWNVAEQQLKNCLNKFTNEWTIKHGDGAFYGPKIDISITDALGRHHQCATIQLDFQLPLRFDLKYSRPGLPEPFERPVIIHRAILGSVERLFAILIESNAGKWPFWLNPKQVLIVPVARPFTNHVVNVCNKIKCEGFMCHMDISEDTSMNEKILLGQKNQYNCILVIGKREIDRDEVSLRTRDGKNRGAFKVHDLLNIFRFWDSTRLHHIEDYFNLKS